MQEELGSVVDVLCADQANLSWAEVAKRDRKVKKYLLVMKASTQEKKATDMKDEVSQALNGIQISDSRFTIGIC